MSELINRSDNRTTIHWKLLTSVSAIALTVYVSSAGVTRAEDAKQPAFWLELGGQFQEFTNPSEVWVPTNLPSVLDHSVAPAAKQRPRFGYDANASLTFTPVGTDWNFTASIKYGKAKRGPKFAHDQTYKTHFHGAKYVPTTYAFTDLHAVSENKHIILDFTAGKDVGLGLFGGHAVSAFNIGLRIAQFTERSDVRMTAQTNVPAKYLVGNQFNAYMLNERKFKGVGPSVAWSGSVPIAGSLQDVLTIDWGANAALLFGRQKTKVRTHTEENDFTGFEYVNTGFTYIPQPQFTQSTHSTLPLYRDKTVTAPNLGGMIGMSFRKGDAKISFGYKADFFFNAIDGGIATAKKEDRGFYGPYLNLSIGFGG